jgi:hypothetical protein
MNLSPHFTLEELTHSQQAVRARIDNTPNTPQRACLELIANLLEDVRQLLGHPIQISSGFRCNKLNSLIGGAKNSQHVLGLAVDFICPGYGTPKEICQTLLASGLKFDQMICEGTWVHLSLEVRGQPMRNQVLTAVFEPGRKTRYLEGLV